eukprot:scaffold203861_cov14-Tisochrysis_lutea.AAC.1
MNKGSREGERAQPQWFLRRAQSERGGSSNPRSCPAIYLVVEGTLELQTLTPQSCGIQTMLCVRIPCMLVQ